MQDAARMRSHRNASEGLQVIERFVLLEPPRAIEFVPLPRVLTALVDVGRKA